MARSSWVKLGLLGFLLATVAFTHIRAEDVDEGVEEDDEYADTARAQLVVRKFVKDDLVVQGMNVTVDIDIYNAGVSTASNVKLVDTLPIDATLLDGSLEADLGKVSVGSHVKHSYVIVFNSGSIEVTLPTARVTYIPEQDSTDKTVGVSSAMTIYVMTPVQQIQRYAIQVGKYVSLGFARSPSDWRNMAIVFGTIGVLLGVNWSIKKVSATRVNRKRAAALRELEKSE